MFLFAGKLPFAEKYLVPADGPPVDNPSDAGDAGDDGGDDNDDKDSRPLFQDSLYVDNQLSFLDNLFAGNRLSFADSPYVDSLPAEIRR